MRRARAARRETKRGKGKGKAGRRGGGEAAVGGGGFVVRFMETRVASRCCFIIMEMHARRASRRGRRGRESENVSPFSGSRQPSRVETTISSFSRRRSRMARGEKPWRRWCARRLRRDRTLARARPLVTRIERRASRVASLTRPREPHLRAAPARRTSRLSPEHEISWRRRRFRAVFANRTLAPRDARHA